MGREVEEEELCYWAASGRWRHQQRGHQRRGRGQRRTGAAASRLGVSGLARKDVMEKERPLRWQSAPWAGGRARRA
jgi:hypothetical protein